MEQFLRSMLGNTWLERIAVIVAILGIWLTVRQVIMGWFFDILSSALYLFVFFGSKLYSEAILQVVFVILGVYGWWAWANREARETKNAELEVRSIRKTEISICIGIVLVGSLAGGCLSKHFGASFPFLDSLLASISIAATWLTARKVLENWYLWIFADTLYVGMFSLKHLYPTAFLYFILILLAIAGLKSWKKNDEKLA